LKCITRGYFFVPKVSHFLASLSILVKKFNGFGVVVSAVDFWNKSDLCKNTVNEKLLGKKIDLG